MSIRNIKKTNQVERLTHKQEQFCRFYLGESNFNATDAARRAGYRGKTSNSLHVIGAQNLRKLTVSARIKQLLVEYGYSEHAIIKCFTDIATFDIRSILTIKEDGTVTFKNGIQELPKTPPIAGIRIFNDRVSEIRLVDPLRALEACAKMLGLFAQQIKIDLKTDELVSGIVDGEISIESLESIRVKLEAIASKSTDGKIDVS